MHLYMFLEKKTYHQKKILYTQGKKVDGIYLVLEGEIGRFVSVVKQKYAKDTEVPISVVCASQAAGLREIMKKEKYWSHTARVNSKSALVLFMDVKNFKKRILPTLSEKDERLDAKFFI